MAPAVLSGSTGCSSVRLRLRLRCVSWFRAVWLLVTALLSANRPVNADAYADKHTTFVQRSQAGAAFSALAAQSGTRRHSLSYAVARDAAEHFVPSVPQYLQSPSVHEVDEARLRASCLHDCTYGHLLHEAVDAYRRLDSVVVLDWQGYRMNGLGNALRVFTGVLASGLLSGRAAFSMRNLPGCTSAEHTTCRMDPGEYFGLWGGEAGHVIDWRWTQRLSETLTARACESAWSTFQVAGLGLRMARRALCTTCPRLWVCYASPRLKIAHGSEWSCLWTLLKGHAGRRPGKASKAHFCTTSGATDICWSE